MLLDFWDKIEKLFVTEFKENNPECKEEEAKQYAENCINQEYEEKFKSF